MGHLFVDFAQHKYIFWLFKEMLKTRDRAPLSKILGLFWTVELFCDPRMHCDTSIVPRYTRKKRQSVERTRGLSREVVGMGGLHVTVVFSVILFNMYGVFSNSAPQFSFPSVYQRSLHS